MSDHVDPEALGKELNFQKRNLAPREIVRSLSWLMSLTGPTVLAFDQLDPIVHQVARQTTIENADEQNTARWIIDQIANGLGALNYNTEGGYNTASGGYALYSNTLGAKNTAFGWEAGKSIRSRAPAAGRNTTAVRSLSESRASIPTTRPRAGRASAPPCP